jgi:hypothetical protein
VYAVPALSVASPAILEDSRVESRFDPPRPGPIRVLHVDGRLPDQALIRELLSREHGTFAAGFCLERSRACHLTLFDGFPALLWCSDSDCKRDCFAMAWPAFTGRGPGQALDEGCAGSAHRDDIERRNASHRDHFGRHPPSVMEHRLRHASDEYRRIRSRTGAGTGFVASISVTCAENSGGSGRRA